MGRLGSDSILSIQLLRFVQDVFDASGIANGIWNGREKSAEGGKKDAEKEKTRSREKECRLEWLDIPLRVVTGVFVKIRHVFMFKGLLHIGFRWFFRC